MCPDTGSTPADSDLIAAGSGCIVNISSSSTHGGQPRMAHYVASESGVVGLTKSLALGFGSRGINSIGFHATLGPARRPEASDITGQVNGVNGGRNT